MALQNTNRSFGSVTKTLHWLMFLMIATVIPVGLMAVNLSHDLRNPDIASTGADFERVFWLFSLHKTLGLAIFFVALVRIIWAIIQPKPGLLNADKPAEAFVARMVHWLLYGSLVLVPLTGWMTHAATSGFAPIRWPFGQSLPFIPKDADLAVTLAGVHMVLERVMILSIALHVIGALKHHFIDRDATLRRMLPGSATVPTPTSQKQGATPLIAALCIWAAALGVGIAAGKIALWSPSLESTTNKAQNTPSAPWQVGDGDLTISIAQLGKKVDGRFARWSADITFEDGPAPGILGMVNVVIEVASLTLGSVSDQALGPDYLDADFFPEATFSGEITRTDTGYLASGPLTIRDSSKLISLPFDLVLDGDRAQMQGAMTLQRLDYGIGENIPDEATLGWTTEVKIKLTATRQ